MSDDKTDKRQAALLKLTPEQRTHERCCILEAAVTALIATHPDREKVRAIFDVLYARHQVTRAQAGAPVETDLAVQNLIDMLFADDTSGES